MQRRRLSSRTRKSSSKKRQNRLFAMTSWKRYARALEQLRSEMKAENARRSLRKVSVQDEPATPTLRDDAVE
eukprot:765775-Hanusia_phi.AAC.5